MKVKRREVLKGVTLAAGGALWPNMARSMFAPEQDKEAVPFLAMPIRGLIKKDRKLLQPIQITLQHSGADITAVTKLNGAEVDRRTLSAGSITYRVLTDSVTSQDVNMTFAIGDAVTSAVVKLEPVRKVTVYVLPSLPPRYWLYRPAGQPRRKTNKQYHPRDRTGSQDHKLPRGGALCLEPRGALGRRSVYAS